MVQRISVREDGLVGTFFLPAREKPIAAIITLNGASGGLNEERAERLASRGFAALALAYFGIEHLPKTLKEIPLEYGKRALDWLKKRPEIDPTRVGLLGVSRGAEFALLLAAFFPETFFRVVAYVPPSATYAAQGESTVSAWIYQGKALPIAPFMGPSSDSQEGLTLERPLILAPYFLKSMRDDPAAFKKALIPVEKIRCPLLLISGEDDQLWPSKLFSEQIAAAVPTTHISYSGAGHFVPPPFIQIHPALKLWFNFGGCEHKNACAHADAWQKTEEFFL